jgi:outer membrane protein assembly factor BamA
MASNESPGDVDVVIDVQERKVNNLQLGLEQLQNGKLSLAVGLKLPNFRNTGEGLYVKGQSILESNFKDYSYLLRYTDPWFLNNPIPFGLSLYQQVNQEAVNTMNAQYIKRAGWEANWDFEVGQDIHYIVSYKNEQVNDILGLYPVYEKNSLRHILMNQTNLDLNNPLAGQRFYAEYERGGSISGIDIGGIDYTRGLVDYSAYWNLYKKDVFAFHVGLGAVAFGNPGLSVFEQDRFSVGGAYSLRGYPDVYTGLPGGMIGNRKLLINTEYRMLLLEWFQLVLFVDAGLASDTELSLGSLKTGRGMGFRIFTPIAPIRFDLALGDSNQFILHFALGQLF